MILKKDLDNGKYTANNYTSNSHNKYYFFHWSKFSGQISNDFLALHYFENDKFLYLKC